MNIFTPNEKASSSRRSMAYRTPLSANATPIECETLSSILSDTSSLYVVTSHLVKHVCVSKSNPFVLKAQ